MADDGVLKAVVTNPEARQKLSQHRDNILAVTGDDENEHWRVGKEFDYVLEGNLAQAAGFKSATEFVLRELPGLSKPTLMRYAAVARSFSEATAARYGTSKLYLLLTLRNLLGLESLPADPGELKFQVPARSAAEAPSEKRFADCSHLELTRVIRQAKGSAPEVGGEEGERVRRLQAALDAALGEESAARVKAHRRNGETVVHLEDVPLEQLAAVLEALRQG